jgi:pantothenate kinase
VQAVRDEAFTHMDGKKLFVRFQQPRDLFPYLLVNIGSGVSMIKVRSRADTLSLSFERAACGLLGCELLPLGVTCYCAGCHDFWNMDGNVLAVGYPPVPPRTRNPIRLTSSEGR